MRVARAPQKKHFACIPRLRRARSPQRVAHATSKMHFACIPRLRHARAPEQTQCHLHSAPSTRTISAEGCAGMCKNAISPAFCAFDAQDLCRGSRSRLTPFAPSSAFNFRKQGRDLHVEISRGHSQVTCAWKSPGTTVTSELSCDFHLEISCDYRK